MIDQPITEAPRHVGLQAFDVFRLELDDLRAQMLPFGEMVENLRKISWICNLFAVPRADAAVRWWAAVSGQVRQRLAMRPKNSFN